MAIRTLVEARTMPKMRGMTHFLTISVVAVFLASTATAGVRIAHPQHATAADSPQAPLVVDLENDPKSLEGSDPASTPVIWRSADGDLSLRLPSPWRVPHSGVDDDGTPFETATLVSFTDEHARAVLNGAEEGLREDLFKIDLGIEHAPAGWTTETILRERCQGVDGRIDCRSTTINGRVWALMRFRDEAYTPVEIVAVATIAGHRMYSLVGFVPAGAHAHSGLDQLDEIFGSLVVIR